jgi:hypothetical protein
MAESAAISSIAVSGDITWERQHATCKGSIAFVAVLYTLLEAFRYKGDIPPRRFVTKEMAAATWLSYQDA